MCTNYFSPDALRPDSVSWPNLTGLRDHTQTHHPRYESSGRVISPKQWPYLTTHNTHNR